MLADTDYTGIALIITASAAAVGSLTGAYLSLRTDRRTKRIDRKVDTLNESTIGELAAADETRRASAINPDQRTAREQRHVDEAPPDEPGQGPRR